MAERQLQSSLLDTVITLWRAKPDGSYELLARNDDYFGRDSYLELDLGAGVYYVGVSASGNDDTIRSSRIRASAGRRRASMNCV